MRVFVPWCLTFLQYSASRFLGVTEVIGFAVVCPMHAVFAWVFSMLLFFVCFSSYIYLVFQELRLLV